MKRRNDEWDDKTGVYPFREPVKRRNHFMECSECGIFLATMMMRLMNPVEPNRIVWTQERARPVYESAAGRLDTSAVVR